MRPLGKPSRGISALAVYEMFAKIERSTYETLNRLSTNSQGNLLFGYMWSTLDTPSLRALLAHI